MKLSDIQTKTSPIFREYGIKHASIFGSIARNEDTPDSDVDILIEIGRPMGLFTYSKLIREVEESLGRRVDMITNKSLNKFLRPYIINDLKTIYEE